MIAWNCCRTCLNSQSLQPIFPELENVEKCSNIVQTVTGIKVDPTDKLPQEMCTNCITFINETMKYRNRCEDSQKHLQNRLANQQHCNVKVESKNFVTFEEITTRVDISLLDQDDDFRDYDDNLTLDTFQYSKVEKTEVNGQIDNFKTDKNDISTELNTNNKKKSTEKVEKVRKKAAKRKGRQDTTEKEKVKEKIECEYCHKILTSKSSMRNHYKIHTGFDVVCEHCGKKFISRRLLLMHCRARHGYEKTDKCSYCDYRASNAEQVKIHERLHTGEKPFVCSECGAGFHRKSSYLQHVAIHLPEKTVQCDICPARFKSVTLMRIHKNRHRAPQYSYRCSECGGEFARRRNVWRHLARAHGGAGGGVLRVNIT